MIIKVIGITVIVLSSCMLLKNSVPVIIPFICFCAGGVILLLCIDSVRQELLYFYDICVRQGYGSYFTLMLKGLGIAYLAGIGADLCRDCGENQLAGRVELAAKIEILILAFPLVRGLIELSESILLG
ncbi:MAG: hypothetical protein IKT46_05815 [Clostridia bacterium]|nr:hypothetical protein [Clostridia bacterium]